MSTTMASHQQDRFKGAVFAVSGAASGIGKALAFELADAGCELALCDKSADNLQSVKSELLDTYPHCVVHTFVVDVSDKHQVTQWAKECEDRFNKIHGLINNAGVSLSASFESLDMEDFHWVMNVNFWGVVYSTQAFLPLLKKSPWGQIINISSLFGLISTPNNSSYNASKFAVRGFSESLSIELQISAPHLSVTCVHPGGVKTGIVTNGKDGAARVGAASRLTKSQREKKFDEIYAKTTAQQAAAIIMAGIRKRQRRVLVGKDARFFDRIQRIAPVKYQNLMIKLFG